MNDASILGSKIRPPLLPEELLERMHLQHLLSKHAWRTLLLVVAPAGYGKTTLLAAWLTGKRQRMRRIAQARGGPASAAWLSLEASDNELPRFLAYLLAALRTAVPGLGQETKAMLEAGQTDIATLLTPLLNELEACGPLTLVLDDFHEIDNPEILKLVSFLLDHAPANFTLAISSRQEPPLPLARLRARRKVFEIRTEDLRLSSAETEHFLRQVAGLSLADQAIDALSRTTEGWLVGLQLATLALQQQSGGIEGEPVMDALSRVFDGSDENVLQFFTQEVLSRERDAVRTFILQSAIVDRIHPQLANAIRQATDSDQLIGELVARKVFLFPIDAQAQWYRYHPLLRQALSTRLAQLVPADEVAGLHRRASDWLEKNGDTEGALRHAIAAGDPDRAARLVAERAGEVWLAGDFLRLASWLAQLHPETIAHHPLLCLYQAWLCTVEGDYRESEGWLKRAKKGTVPARDKSSLAWRMMTWPPLIRFQHNYRAEPARKAAELALSRLPTAAGDSRVVALLTLGNSAIMLGDPIAAEKALIAAVELAEHLASDYLIYLTYWSLIQHQLLQAQLDQALESAARLERVAARSRFRLQLQAAAEFGRGEVALERMKVDLANAHYQRALGLGRQIGNRVFEANCLIRLAWVLELQNMPEAAMQSMDQGWKLVAERKSDADSLNIVDAQRAGLALRLGQQAIVEAWQARQKPPKSGRRNLLRGAGPTEQITLVHALINEGGESIKEALRRLASLSKATIEKGDGRLLVAIPAMQALAEYKLSYAEAHGTLQQALERAAGQGMKRIFIILGPPMRDLLQAHVMLKPHHPYASEVLAVFELLRHADEQEGDGFPVSLSARERQILQLAAEGMENQQIADELIISINTVKTHLKRINTKLQVNNRTAAVTRARELALL